MSSPAHPQVLVGKFSSWAIFTRNNKFLKKETFQWLLFIRWGRFLETPIFSIRKWVSLLQTLEIVICPQWKSILHKHPLSWSSRQAHSPPEASWVIVFQKVLALLPKTLCPNHTLTPLVPHLRDHRMGVVRFVDEHISCFHKKSLFKSTKPTRSPVNVAGVIYASPCFTCWGSSFCWSFGPWSCL